MTNISKRRFAVAIFEEGKGVRYCTKDYRYDKKGYKVPILGSKKEARLFCFVGFAFDFCDMFNIKYKKNKPYFVVEIKI